MGGGQEQRQESKPATGPNAIGSLKKVSAENAKNKAFFEVATLFADRGIAKPFFRPSRRPKPAFLVADYPTLTSDSLIHG